MFETRPSKTSSGKGLHSEVNEKVPADEVRVFLLHGRLQFQGIQLHDDGDRCVRSNELTFLNQAIRNGSAGGSSNRCISHFLFCEFIAGTAVLQACLQGTDILQSRLHRGLRHFEASLVGIKIGSRG